MLLTVFFNGQFWVGLIEKQAEGKYFSCLHTFGAEPSDIQILDFVINDLFKIIKKQSEFIESEISKTKKINPKRMKRKAAKEMLVNPLSTKSQETIQKQTEKNKKEKMKCDKETSEKMKEYKRQKAIEKRKMKHKGK
jgi:hypothetical protein